MTSAAPATRHQVPPLGAISLITVSRDFGSGGSAFAAALGAAIGWPVLDREIIERVAHKLHRDCGDIAWLDEHSPRLRERIASALLFGPPELPVALDTAGLVEADGVAAAASEVLREAAQSPPLIVVGHGAQCLYAGREGTLHIRLFAAMHVRIARLMADHGWDETMAEAQARRMDEERTRYVRRYFGHDRYDPLLFDLQLNSGRFDLEQMLAIVRRALEA
jgi:cytidylate kinase